MNHLPNPLIYTPSKSDLVDGIWCVTPLDATAESPGRLMAKPTPLLSPEMDSPFAACVAKGGGFLSCGVWGFVLASWCRTRAQLGDTLSWNGKVQLSYVGLVAKDTCKYKPNRFIMSCKGAWRVSIKRVGGRGGG